MKKNNNIFIIYRMSKEIDGEGIALEKFIDNKEVLLPVLNEKTIEMPKFFIRQIASKKGRKFRLFVPTTKTRNLSTRQKTKSMYVERLDKDEVTIIDNPNYEKLDSPPKLSEFSKKDREKLTEFFEDVKKEEKKTHKLNERPETGTNPKRKAKKTAVVEPAKEAPKEKIKVQKITIKGKQYLRTIEDELYDTETRDFIGMWDKKTNTIVEDDEEDEEEEAPKPKEKVKVTRIIISGHSYLKTIKNELYDAETRDFEGIWKPETKTIDRAEEEIMVKGKKYMRTLMTHKETGLKKNEVYDDDDNYVGMWNEKKKSIIKGKGFLKKKIRGKGLAAESFDETDPKTEVLLPVLNDKTLYVPEYFIQQVFSKRLKEGQRKFKLFAPTTSSRNLSTRKGEKSLKVLRVNKDELELKDGNFTPAPNLSEFSKKDREKLKEFFKSVKEPLKEFPLQTKKTPVRRLPSQVEEPEPAFEEPFFEDQPEPEPAPAALKKKGRPSKYANDEERRQAKLQQQRNWINNEYKQGTAERLKRKAIRKGTYNPPTMETQSYEGENDIVEGEGIIKSITKGVNKAVNVVSKKGKEVGKFIEKVINPDAFMPPSVKAIMNPSREGQEIITSITLRRNPVSHLITGAMNAVSLGSFQKKLDEQSYDELFHLAMLVQTDKTKFLLEKIERVNVTSSIGNPQGLETLPCPLNGKEITIFDLINKTKEKMGKTSFLDYDPVSNNCQVFLMNVLDANGLLNAENKGWVKQDTEVLFKNNKVLAKVSKKLTDIGASANVLLKGGNLDNYEKNKISTNIIMKDFNYLLPQKAEQHKNLLARDTYDLPEPLQAGMGVGRTFKKLGRKVSRLVDKVEGGIDKAENIQDEVNKAISKMKGIPDKAKAHLKDVGLDVAEILLKRGVPVTAGTIAGILATAVAGPAAGVAASVTTGYATQIAMNEVAKRENIEGSGLGSGLYAQGRGFDSEDECCGMCGGKLLIDRKFSVRDVFDAAKSVPKVYKENMKSLKEGKQEGSGMKNMTRTMPPRPTQEITNGIVAPKMSGRGAKGSPEMKEKMAKLRAMRKK